MSAVSGSRKVCAAKRRLLRTWVGFLESVPGAPADRFEPAAGQQGCYVYPPDALEWRRTLQRSFFLGARFVTPLTDPQRPKVVRLLVTCAR